MEFSVTRSGISASAETAVKATAEIIAGRETGIYRIVIHRGRESIGKAVGVFHEAELVALELHRNRTDLTVTVLGHQDLRIFLVINGIAHADSIRTMHEENDIGILLYGTGLTQVAQHRAVVAVSTLHRISREL